MSHGNQSSSVRTTRMSDHVVQFAVPTPTLPPSFETNTYLIHAGDAGLLVDVGAKEPDLIQALCEQIQELGVNHILGILVTHYHRDHTEGIPEFLSHHKAPVYVHSLDLVQAAEEMHLEPHLLLEMPQAFKIGDTVVQIHHAPGHTHGHVHITIPADNVILVGDHLAGDGSVWIGPPDGHMATYFTALDHIATSGCTIAGPGHGAVIQDAKGASERLKARRMAREAEILRLITEQPQTIDSLINHLYRGTVPENAMWVAKKTIQGHLEHLLETAQITRIWNEASEQFQYVPSVS